MMKQSGRFCHWLLAALLALAFALALLPAAVFAADPQPETVVTAAKEGIQRPFNYTFLTMYFLLFIHSSVLELWKLRPN